MTKAMPFLQKVILLSYDPRPFPAGAFSRFGGISCAAISFFRRETQSLVTGKTTVESPEMSEIARNGREFLLAIFPSCHYNEDTVWGEVV